MGTVFIIAVSLNDEKCVHTKKITTKFVNYLSVPRSPKKSQHAIHFLIMTIVLNVSYFTSFLQLHTKMSF